MSPIVAVGPLLCVGLWLLPSRVLCNVLVQRNPLASCLNDPAMTCIVIVKQTQAHDSQFADFTYNRLAADVKQQQQQQLCGAAAVPVQQCVKYGGSIGKATCLAYHNLKSFGHTSMLMSNTSNAVCHHCCAVLQGNDNIFFGATADIRLKKLHTNEYYRKKGAACPINVQSYMYKCVIEGYSTSPQNTYHTVIFFVTLCAACYLPLSWCMCHCRDVPFDA